jgi:aldehyde dehydrogenase (NAD+)
VPKGVFNLLNGLGGSARERASGHRHDLVHRLDRAGVDVASAPRRPGAVSQELGGKSANVILDDADLTRR